MYKIKTTNKHTPRAIQKAEQAKLRKELADKKLSEKANPEASNEQ